MLPLADPLSVHRAALFSDAFVVRLFELVELTRDERDDSFNYTLVKLIVSGKAHESTASGAKDLLK